MERQERLRRAPRSTPARSASHAQGAQTKIVVGGSWLHLPDLHCEFRLQRLKIPSFGAHSNVPGLKSGVLHQKPSAQRASPSASFDWHDVKHASAAQARLPGQGCVSRAGSHAPLPSQKFALSSPLETHDAAALHTVVSGASTHAPDASQSNPHVPLPTHSAVQQRPTPLAPQKPLTHSAFELHVFPALFWHFPSTQSAPGSAQSAALEQVDLHARPSAAQFRPSAQGTASWVHTWPTHWCTKLVDPSQVSSLAGLHCVPSG
jgi:hypothetical protein